MVATTERVGFYFLDSSCSAAGLPSFANRKSPGSIPDSFKLFDDVTFHCTDGYGFFDGRRVLTSVTVSCHHYGFFQTVWEYINDFKCEGNLPIVIALSLLCWLCQTMK